MCKGRRCQRDNLIYLRRGGGRSISQNDLRLLLFYEGMFTTNSTQLGVDELYLKYLTVYMYISAFFYTVSFFP